MVFDCLLLYSRACVTLQGMSWLIWDCGALMAVWELNRMFGENLRRLYPEKCSFDSAYSSCAVVCYNAMDRGTLRSELMSAGAVGVRLMPKPSEK